MDSIIQKNQTIIYHVIDCSQSTLTNFNNGLTILSKEFYIIKNTVDRSLNNTFILFSTYY